MAKLKVFRTPAGFFDAYVAATSQKAALKAWGADADLFARGAAEQVTDAALMAEPLSRPGEVVRVTRGSDADHFEALPKTDVAKRAKKPARAASKRDETAKPPTPKAKPRPPQKPRPSRAALEEAEQALADMTPRYEAALKAIKARELELQNQRKALQQRRDADAKRLEDELAAARKDYSRAIEAWARDDEAG